MSNDQSDHGVGVDGNLVCQNFEEHPDEEVTMVPGPYDGVMCPKCGRMAGGPAPLDIPYVDDPPRRKRVMSDEH